MSHYTVAVITADINKIESMLAPYDENLEVTPYIYRTKQEIIEAENNLEQALANQTFTYETVKQILIEQKADQLFYQITIEEILACIFE